jgi:hypothetical protein
MADDNLLAHLEDMAKTFKRLSSLVTSEAPLTPNNIYLSSILTSLPPDWLACVSSMMNEPWVDPKHVIDTLKAKHLRRKTQSSNQDVVESAALAAMKGSSKGKAPKPGQPVCHCTFCNLDGHDLNWCSNVARLIETHKLGQAPPQSKKPTNNRLVPINSSSNFPAKAGHTSAAILNDDPHGSNDESDFSGSKLEIRAGQAAISLSSSLPSVPSEDVNLDLGCSISMTPDPDAVSLAKPN